METRNELPKFNRPIKVEIEQFPSGDTFFVTALTKSNPINEQDVEDVIRICSEPLIYERLFKELLDGKPYTKEGAKDWLKSVQEGWETGEKYVFFIRNEQGRICAAMDIKSGDTESAEIGYWASSEVPGIMTNAVVALCSIAEKAGFKQLYGLTLPNNDKSMNVLKRANFQNVGEVTEDGKKYTKYVKDL